MDVATTSSWTRFSPHYHPPARDAMIIGAFASLGSPPRPYRPGPPSSTTEPPHFTSASTYQTHLDSLLDPLRSEIKRSIPNPRSFAASTRPEFYHRGFAMLEKRRLSGPSPSDLCLRKVVYRSSSRSVLAMEKVSTLYTRRLKMVGADPRSLLSSEFGPASPSARERSDGDFARGAEKTLKMRLSQGLPQVLFKGAQRAQAREEEGYGSIEAFS